VASSKACAQSQLSYPRIVARRTGADLTDASCGGATTDTATTSQEIGSSAPWPPQLDAVERDTELVTVGLGYNNGGYYIDALFTCSSASSASLPNSRCPDPAARTADIRAALAAVLDQVHDRAPSADVLVVGYPQLVPESGTCPELPLPEGDYPYVHELLRLLDDSLRRAAEDGDATFVDVYGASKGHDICAGDEAWVNGVTGQPGVAAPYHPFASTQRAVADLVVAALD
jgi:hypothetical protein